MKIIKFASLILAITFLSILLPACGEVIVVKDVRLSVLQENTKGELSVLLDTVVSDVKSTDGEAPTVLDAVIQLLEENGINHKHDGTSITSIKSKSESTKSGYAYYWEFKVNGKDGKRAGEMLINEGDHIAYYLVPEKVEGADNSEDVDESAEDVVDEETAE